MRGRKGINVVAVYTGEKLNTMSSMDTMPHREDIILDVISRKPEKDVALALRMEANSYAVRKTVFYDRMFND